MAAIEWREAGDRWFIAHVDGKPVSAFRFESKEVHQKRTYCDSLNNPVGMWISWVPYKSNRAMSERLTWPEETSVEQLKADVEAADIRLHDRDMKKDEPRE